MNRPNPIPYDFGTIDAMYRANNRDSRDRLLGEGKKYKSYSQWYYYEIVKKRK